MDDSRRWTQRIYAENVRHGYIDPEEHVLDRLQQAQYDLQSAVLETLTYAQDHLKGMVYPEGTAYGEAIHYTGRVVLALAEVCKLLDVDLETIAEEAIVALEARRQVPLADVGHAPTAAELSPVGGVR